MGNEREPERRLRKNTDQALFSHLEDLPQVLRTIVEFRIGRFDGQLHSLEETCAHMDMNMKTVANKQTQAFALLRHFNGELDINVPKQYAKWITARNAGNLVSFERYEAQNKAQILLAKEERKKEIQLKNVEKKSSGRLHFDPIRTTGWEKLPEQYKKIIDMSFGLSDGTKHSPEEIATALSLSADSINSLRSKAYAILDYMRGNTKIKIPKRYKRWIDSFEGRDFIPFEEYSIAHSAITHIEKRKERVQAKTQNEDALFTRWQELPEKHRIIIGLLMGYADGNRHSYEAIGQDMGVKPAQIRKMRNQARAILAYMEGDRDITIPSYVKKWIDAQKGGEIIPFKTVDRDKKAKQKISTLQELSDVQDPDDIVKEYLRDVQKFPLLTAEEEIELTVRMAKGRTFIGEEHNLDTIVLTSDAKFVFDKLVESNLRFVIFIAKRYQGRGVDFLDLINAGNIGLMTGISKFEPERGWRLSTCCGRWIQQAITREISNKGRTIRVPEYFGYWLNEVNAAKTVLRHRFDREPTLNEVATQLDMPLHEFKKKMKLARMPASLDEPIRDGDLVLGDRIPDSTPSVEDTVETHENSEVVEQFLRLLTPKQREVLELRNGIGGEELSLKKAGAKLDLSPEKVSQIESQALRTLRALVRNT